MEIISSRVVYECPIFRVEEREVRVQDVLRTYYYVVRQPAVAVVALTNDKKIVLQRELVGRREQEKLCLPAGKMESYHSSDDELEKQAVQELQEEAGYTAENIALLFVEDAVSNTLERKYYKYAAWNLTWVGQQLEPGERITPFLATPEEAERLARADAFAFPEEKQAVLQALTFFRQKKLL